jgi:hypothetical protein
MPVFSVPVESIPSEEERNTDETQEIEESQEDYTLEYKL